MLVGRLLALAAQRVDDVVLVQTLVETVARIPTLPPLAAVGRSSACAHLFLALVVRGREKTEEPHCQYEASRIGLG